MSETIAQTLNAWMQGTPLLKLLYIAAIICVVTFRLFRRNASTYKYRSVGDDGPDPAYGCVSHDGAGHGGDGDGGSSH